MLSASALYRHFLMVREEILKHKWCMSEREGRDVGFERALLDWTTYHKANWDKFNN